MSLFLVIPRKNLERLNHVGAERFILLREPFLKVNSTELVSDVGRCADMH